MAPEGGAKPTVYVDTTVVSYLTARQSRDPVTAAHQQVMRERWPTARSRFNLVVSDLVIVEAGAGDPSASRARLAALEGTEIISATAESRSLAGQVLASGALPRTAGPDAAHVAMAATNGVGYLVTWNLRHMAGAAARTAIARACRRAGYRPPGHLHTQKTLGDRGMTPYKDPIVEEVRAIRAKIFAKHGGTIEGLFKHLMEVQRTSGRTYVSYPPTRIDPETEEIPAPKKVSA